MQSHQNSTKQVLKNYFKLLILMLCWVMLFLVLLETFAL